MGLREELEREVRTFSLGDLAWFAGTSAVVGGLAGAVGGPLGALAGAVGGAIRGALTYAAAYGIGLATYGITGDPKASTTVRRFSEIALSFGNIFRISKLGLQAKALKASKSPEPIVSPSLTAKLISKVPNEVKLGAKALSFGFTTGWVLEPYLVEDGDSMALKPVGVSALAASAYLVSRPLAPLGMWGWYASRNVLREALGPKVASGVLTIEPIRKVGPINLERLQIPALRLGPEGLEVMAVDPLKEGPWHATVQVAELRSQLDGIAKVLQKHGIKVGSPISQSLGKALFDPFEEADIADVLKLELKAQGLSDLAIEEISSAIKEWQKVSISIANQLSDLGGTAPHYLASLGGSKRFFQHIFFKQKPEGDFIQLVAERALEGKGRSPIPTIATTRRRGTVVRLSSTRGQELLKEFQKQTGRKPKVGDLFTDSKGRKWLLTPLKKGSKPVWWSETIDIGREDVVLDLAGSLYVQLSQDLRLLKRLHFFKYMNELGKLTGKVTSDPARGKELGYIKLVEGTSPSPVVKKWGPLTGKFVSPDLKKVLDAYIAMDTYTPPKFPVIGRGLAWLNRGWKNLRLGLSIKSWQNAFFGNLLISFAHGRDPLQILSHAIMALTSKSKFDEAILREAQKFDILRTGIAYETYEREFNELRKILQTDQGKLEALGWKILAFTQRVIQDGVKGFSFGNIDALFKLGFYRSLRLEGVPVEEAAKKAVYAFGYYGDLPVVARSLRDTIMPFISFQLRVLPQVFSALYRNPERLAMVALTFEGIQRAAFRELYGDLWREGAQFEMLDIIKYNFMDFRPSAFMADFIRTPTMVFELPDGSSVEVPSGYMYAGWIPWNIPLSIPHVGPIPGKEPGTVFLTTLIIQNPILRFAAGLLTHVDPATGRKIGGYERLNPPSVIDTAMRTLSPLGSAWSSFFQLNAKEGWFDPIISWFNYFGTYPNGEPVGTAHMIWNALGPSVLRFDPEYNLEFALRRLEALERGWLMDYRRAVRRSANVKVLEDNWHALELKIEENFQRKAELIERYLKAR